MLILSISDFVFDTQSTSSSNHLFTCTTWYSASYYVLTLIVNFCISLLSFESLLCKTISQLCSTDRLSRSILLGYVDMPHSLDVDCIFADFDLPIPKELKLFFPNSLCVPKRFCCLKMFWLLRLLILVHGVVVLWKSPSVLRCLYLRHQSLKTFWVLGELGLPRKRPWGVFDEYNRSVPIPRQVLVVTAVQRSWPFSLLLYVVRWGTWLLFAASSIVAKDSSRIVFLLLLVH